MKETFKKISAVFVAVLIVVISCLSGLTAFAANGTGTITVDNAKAGETYQFYKLLDLTWREATPATADDRTDDVYAYTIEDEWVDFFGSLNITGWDTLTTKALKDRAAYNYLAAIASDSDALHTFATDAKQYADDNSIAAKYSLTGAAGTATQNNAEYGYYVMVPTDTSTGTVLDTTGNTNDTGAVFSVDTVTPTVTISNKSFYGFDFDKQVSLDGTNFSDAVNAAIGDTVTFKITTSLADLRGYDEYYYTITDTLAAGFKLADNFGKSNVTVTMDGDDYDAYSVTVTGDNAHTLVIAFDDFIDEGWTSDEKDVPIVITYTAELDTDATIGKAGNSNSAYLQFSNNPADATSFDRTPSQVANVYTGSFEFTKVASGNTALNGAVFKLTANAGQNIEDVNIYLANGTTKATTGTSETALTDGQVYYKASESAWYMRTNSDGKFVIEGLKEGAYTLEETTAPDGYVALNGAINVSLACNDESLTVTFGETNEAAFTNSVSGNAADTINTNTALANGGLSFNVVNESQTLLPKTGAIGGVALAAVGTALVGGFFALNRKKKNED